MRADRLPQLLAAKANDNSHPLPAGGEVAWQWFVDLHATRRMGFNGPEPITYCEIEAYARLKRWPLEPRHVETIRALDDEWLDAEYKRLTKKGVKTLPPYSGQAVNPAAFDAVFG